MKQTYIEKQNYGANLSHKYLCNKLKIRSHLLKWNLVLNILKCNLVLNMYLNLILNEEKQVFLLH